MNRAVEIKNLTKDYGEFKLDRVNITLPAGYIMGFIGENGAGKTTTIKAMLGLIHRDAGEIRLLGKPLDPEDREIKERLGVVMDESGFPDDMTLKDIDRVLGDCYRTWSSQVFRQYAERFVLPEARKIKEYSKGMRMKLSIAAALSHDSKLLILDEATGGLDPVVRDEILEVFREFIQDEEKSVFISSHILSDLEKICDYITFIHQGRIIFSEEKDALMEKYAVVKCSREDLDRIDTGAIVASRENQFGLEVLAQRSGIDKTLPMDTPTMEDIMLYFVKEDVK